MKPYFEDRERKLVKVCAQLEKLGDDARTELDYDLSVALGHAERHNLDKLGEVQKAITHLRRVGS